MNSGTTQKDSTFITPSTITTKATGGEIHLSTITATASTTTTMTGNNINSTKDKVKKASITKNTPTLTKTETVFCGSTAGVVSRFVVAPLDVVKIRLQMQTQRKDLSTILRRSGSGGAGSVSTGTAISPPKYRNMFQGMALIAREEGIKGLWKGNMAAEYLYLTYGGIQFLVYQQSKEFLSKSARLASSKVLDSSHHSGIQISFWKKIIMTLTDSSASQSFVAGATAGITATACTYPFDLLRTRFAIQKDVKVYTGVPQAFRHIYTHEGIRGFYKGMAPSLIQVVPYMGIMFGSYDTLKHVAAWIKIKMNARAALKSKESQGGSTPPPRTTTTTTAGKSTSVVQLLLGFEDLLCGALSGMISKTGVYPLDLVRKRLQIQGSSQKLGIAAAAKTGSPATSLSSSSSSSLILKSPISTTEPSLPTNVWRCILHIVKHEGYLALYKGLLPGILKAAPASAVTFLVFSQAGLVVERIRRPEQSLARAAAAAAAAKQEHEDNMAA